MDGMGMSQGPWRMVIDRLRHVLYNDLSRCKNTFQQTDVVRVFVKVLSGTILTLKVFAIETETGMAM